MSSFDWKSFLKQWSQDILESIDRDQEQLSPEVVESGWLGYPGATEEEISNAEARLGTQFPPSYRAFLKVSNGWRQTTPFIHRLWSTEEIEWFTAKHQGWVDALSEKIGQIPVGSFNASLSSLSVPDEEYFVYGDEQDCSKIRVEYLQTALEISNCGERAIYLLNPQVVSEDGEWEAWFLGDWLPGADRYPSFQSMMQAEYESFLDLRETPVKAIVPNLKIDAEASKPHSTPTDMKTHQIVGILSEQSPESKNSSCPAPTAEEEWQGLASFLVEFQSKQVQEHFEQRTVIRSIESDAVKIYSGINPEVIQQYILEQLNSVIHQSSKEEETAVIEITQLRVVYSSETETFMVVDNEHPVFPEAIEQNKPFTLEVSMQIASSTANLGKQKFDYRIQCLAHNLSTQLDICLGDNTNNILVGDRSDYVARFPHLILREPGIYRLKIWVTLQNISASPSYFKVPMLQVV